MNVVTHRITDIITARREHVMTSIDLKLARLHNHLTRSQTWWTPAATHPEPVE